MSTPTAPSWCVSPSSTMRLPPGALAADASPPIITASANLAAQTGEQRVHGKRVGIGQEHERVFVQLFERQTLHRPSSSSRCASRRTARTSPVRPAHNDTPGRSSTSCGATDDRFGGDTDQHTRPQQPCAPPRPCRRDDRGSARSRRSRRGRVRLRARRSVGRWHRRSWSRARDARRPLPNTVLPKVLASRGATRPSCQLTGASRV